MGGQHHRVDRLKAERRPEKVGESRGMEGIGCQVICGAPTVSQTTGYVNVNVNPRRVITHFIEYPIIIVLSSGYITISESLV